MSKPNIKNPSKQSQGSEGNLPNQSTSRVNPSNQSTSKGALKQKSNDKDVTHALYSVFKEVSRNGTTIDPEQVGRILHSLDLTLSPVDLQHLIIQMKSYDPKRRDGITFTMFQRGLTDEIERIAKLSEYKAVFEELFNPQTGTINADCLELFFRKKLGEKFDHQFYSEMLEYEKELDYKHFCKIMKRVLQNDFAERDSSTRSKSSRKSNKRSSKRQSNSNSKGSRKR